MSGSSTQNGEVHFERDRSTLMALLVFGACLSVACAYAVHMKASQADAMIETIFPAVLALIFSLMTLVLAVLLLRPTDPAYRVTAKGIEINTLWGKKAVPWSRVKNIRESYLGKWPSRIKTSTLDLVSDDRKSWTDSRTVILPSTGIKATSTELHSALCEAFRSFKSHNSLNTN